MKKCKVKGCSARRFRKGYKTCSDHWQLGGAASEYVPKPKPEFAKTISVPEKKPAPKLGRPPADPEVDKRRALSDEQIMCIRNEYKGIHGQKTKLAQKYGVDIRTIQRIVGKRTYS